MQYFYLALAIVAEVIGTTCLKASEGFSKIVPSIVALFAYGVAFFFLSLVLKTIPTGVAYAIWSGVGIVLIASAAWAFQGQKLDAPALIGMGLIIVGVVIINVFSSSAAA